MAKSAKGIQQSQRSNGASPVKGSAPIWKMLSIKLLDPPVVNMRVTVEDEHIAGLAASIRDTGLIYPICVVAEDARFRICAGYCRYLACKQLGRDEVECRDYTNTGVPPEQIKAHENLWRKDPNDGELVQWLRDENARRTLSMDDLRQMTGKSEHWINSRMAICRGDEQVFLAMVHGQISLAQATVLNKFPDDYRNTYLQNVIQSTPPAHLIEQWLRDVRMMLSHQQPGANIPPPVPVEAMPGIAPVEACTLCGGSHSSWTFVLVRAHQGCIDTIVKQLEEGGFKPK